MAEPRDPGIPTTHGGTYRRWEFPLAMLALFGPLVGWIIGRVT